MKIHLNSDFRDYYDHEFCGSFETPDVTLNRCMEDGLSRKDIFKFLSKPAIRAGMHAHVITHGKVRKLKNSTHVVVYTDEYKHAGEGKILLPYEEALVKYPNHLASDYFPHNHTIKFVQIGKLAFKLSYSSDHWMSNCGDVKIELISTSEPLNIDLPIFSIDMVRGHMIDFNTSPGLKHTPIHDMLGPVTIYRLIEEYYEAKNGL